VLGGIAVAALLTQMTDLIKGIQMGRWHLLLYFLASIMLIANSWVQQAWGGLVLRVHVSMLGTLISLTNLICMALICLQLTNPMIYFAVGGLNVLSAILMQIFNMKSGAWVVLTPERIKGIKTIIWIYLILMALCFGAAANLFWVPSVAAEVGWGVFALLGSIATIVMQHNGMIQERKELGIP
jgi:hypothetical protein